MGKPSAPEVAADDTSLSSTWCLPSYRPPVSSVCPEQEVQILSGSGAGAVDRSTWAIWRDYLGAAAINHNDFEGDLLRDTDDDADDTVLHALMREQFERSNSRTYRERLTSADSRSGPRLPWSADRARAHVSYLPDEASQEKDSLGIRVLILEDDPESQEFFSLLLTPEQGFQVQYVSEVATCLERLRATSAWSDSPSSTEQLRQLPFDVLLLDVRLHGRHRGTEVFTAAQKDPGLRLPPIVICTALVDRALAAVLKDCRTGLLAYNVRVVLKPFNSDTLTAELRSAVTSRGVVLASAYRPRARGIALAEATTGTL
jgi:CheY-like chemotaxis protein